MAAFGYSYVSDKGFIAFLREFSQGAWKDVSIKKHDAEDQMPAVSLLEAPQPVVWKLRATWGIRRLSEVVGGPSAEVLAGFDNDWDSVQRKLYHFLGAAAEEGDAGKRAAAGRLQGLLLSGAGTAQTGFSYDDEIDFGWNQLEIVKEDGPAADAKKVALGPLLSQIETTTEALAKGMGRSAGQKRAAPRSLRLREALAICSSSFNAIHEEMEWILEHTPAGPARTLLEEMCAPFDALLSRFPPPATSKADATASDPATPDAPKPA